MFNQTTTRYIYVFNQECPAFFIMGQIVNLIIVSGPQKDLRFESDSDFAIFIPKT